MDPDEKPSEPLDAGKQAPEHTPLPTEKQGILAGIGAWLHERYHALMAQRLKGKLRQAYAQVLEEIDHSRSPGGILRHARGSLDELRMGVTTFSTNLALKNINAALECGWTYADLGTTQEEVIGFRNGASQITYAASLLGQYRKKKQETFRLRELLEEMHWEPKTVGTTVEELDGIDRASFVALYRNTVATLRAMAEGDLRTSGDNPDEFSQRICNAVHDGIVTFQDLGTSLEELADLLPRAWLQIARKRWEFFRCEAEEGNMVFSDTFAILYEALGKAKKTLADIGVTEQDLAACRRTGLIGKARKTLASLRGEEPQDLSKDQREIRLLLQSVIKKPDQARRIREMLQKAGATLEEIGTSDKELDRLAGDSEQ